MIDNEDEIDLFRSQIAIMDSNFMRLRDDYRHCDDIRQGALQSLLEAEKEIERLLEALHEWDALIYYNYNGSREAMSAMTYAAQNTAAILYGEPPWPPPRSALKESE